MHYNSCVILHTARRICKARLLEHFPPRTGLWFGTRFDFFILVRAGIVGRMNERNDRRDYRRFGRSSLARAARGRGGGRRGRSLGRLFVVDRGTAQRLTGLKLLVSDRLRD